MLGSLLASGFYVLLRRLQWKECNPGQDWDRDVEGNTSSSQGRKVLNGDSLLGGNGGGDNQRLEESSGGGGVLDDGTGDSRDGGVGRAGGGRVGRG